MTTIEEGFQNLLAKIKTQTPVDPDYAQFLHMVFFAGASCAVGIMLNLELKRQNDLKPLVNETEKFMSGMIKHPGRN